MEMLRSAAARATRDRSSGLALLAAVFAPAVLALVLVAVVTPSLGASEAMPVALVNLDRGAEDAAGHEVRAGEDLVDELLDSGDVVWVETNRAAADSGLASGDFALIVQIPENYSEQVASLGGDEPERAQIQVISDGSQNVLATREGAQVMRQVQQRLRGELGEDYLVSVLNDVNGEASRLTLTADGAVVLDDAYDVLEQGAAGVATGLEQTAAGTGVLVQGVDGIAQGVGALGAGNQALAEGIDMVNEQAATPLAAGSEALVAGLDQAADGLTTIAQGIDGAGALASGANELLSQSSSSLASLAGLSGELAAPAQELSQAQTQMASVSGSVIDAAEDATQGIEQARGGVDAASEAAGALASTVKWRRWDGRRHRGCFCGRGCGFELAWCGWTCPDHRPCRCFRGRVSWRAAICGAAGPHRRLYGRCAGIPGIRSTARAGHPNDIAAGGRPCFCCRRGSRRHRCRCQLHRGILPSIRKLPGERCRG